MTFDITILGADGGPLEGSTTCFLVKSGDVTYQDIIAQNLKSHIVAIDAGVGLGRITELIQDSDSPLKQLKYYRDSLTLQEAGTDLIHRNDVLKFDNTELAPIEIAHELLKRVNTYLVTHAHMDHIAGLIINSPSFGRHSRKRLHGLESVLTHLHKHAFNDIIWPDLASIDKGRFVSIQPLSAYIFGQPVEFQKLNDQYNVLTFQVIHGVEIDETAPYHSTAYLLQDNTTKDELLVFGDVEADNGTTKTKNAEIWSVVSKSLLEGRLKSIIIECSTVNQSRNKPLYGHLTPFSLFKELLALKGFIEKIDPGIFDPLRGLDILISHVKDVPTSKTDPRKLILNELNELNEQYGLGIKFTVLLAGQTYSV